MAGVVASSWLVHLPAAVRNERGFGRGRWGVGCGCGRWGARESREGIREESGGGRWLVRVVGVTEEIPPAVF